MSERTKIILFGIAILLLIYFFVPIVSVSNNCQDFAGPGSSSCEIETTWVPLYKCHAITTC